MTCNLNLFIFLSLMMHYMIDASKKPFDDNQSSIVYHEFSVPCLAAHYLDQIHGCRQCSKGTYSSGGTTSSCSNCPTGKTVAAGTGSFESDCYWSKSR